MVEEKLREKLDQKNSNQDIKGIKRTESGVRLENQRKYFTWRFGDDDLLLTRVAPLPLHHDVEMKVNFCLFLQNLCRRGVEVLPSSDSPSVSMYPDVS